MMAFRTTAVKLGENSANMHRWGLVIQRGLQRAKDSLKGTQSRWLLLEVVTYMRTCWIEGDWITVSGTFLLIKTQVKRIFFLLTLAKVKDKKFVLLTKLVQSRWWILAKFSFMDRDAKIARADIQPPKKEHALSITDLLNSKIFRLESRITSLKITTFRRKTLVFIGEKW